MTTQPYRPSNGTEGEFFYDAWCIRCTREAGNKHCRIYGMAMACRISDPKYPKEWVCDANVPWDQSNPRCTAFREPKPHVRPNRIRDRRQIGLSL